MGDHLLLPITVNTKSERKADSLPTLGLKAAIFSMQAQLSERSAKFHPKAGDEHG
jgi:hypothetical protein